MAERNERTGLMTPGFISDPNSIIRLEGGRQIDWPNVPDSYKNARGKKVIQAGTPVGDLLDTDANRKSVSPRVVTTNPAVGVLESTAVEDDPSAAKSGYGIIVGGVLFEDQMEMATGNPKTLPAAIKNELAANGQFVWDTKGHNSMGD